ncbi:MAG: sugar ABC transporter permease [Lachnospiraceae bacterium]|nr:sugar ABC transporter permease [Lachnospiraceae bacterium]
MEKSKVLSSLQKYTMVIALVVVFILFSILTDGKILVAQNINNLISQNAYVFVLATGMLLCILTGGNIDLSVGSIIAFAGGIGAVIMERGGNCWVAVIVILIVGTLVGVLQGYFIAFIKVPPFIATLAGMYAFRGLANVVLQGFAVTVEDKTFLNVFGGGADCYVPDVANFVEGKNGTCLIAGILGIIIYLVVTFGGRVKAKKAGYTVDPLAGTIAKAVIISAVILWITNKLASFKGIPSALVWIGLVLFIYTYVTTKTTMGRYLYAVGGNEKATRLSGINTKNVYFFAYANMGLLAGLAAILTIARASSAQPTYGQGYEMDAIAACFIGGASAYGGIGNVGGVVIGAVLMGVINQGMSIMGVDANYQKVVKGLVLLFAVLFDILSKRDEK